MKPEWTIRIINPIPYGPTAKGHVGLPGVWVEQLRRLGVLRIIRQYDGVHTKNEAGDFEDGYEVLELYCNNRAADPHAWCDMQASRMKSFGINAVAAPKWDGAAL